MIFDVRPTGTLGWLGEPEGKGADAAHAEGVTTSPSVSAPTSAGSPGGSAKWSQDGDEA
jgi:hypothetical protein